MGRGWFLPVRFISSPDQTQPPVFGLTGLRYQGVLKFLPARALPACCSRTSGLNRFTRVSASAHWIGRLIPSSRRTLPGKPEGFSRSNTKRLPARGSTLNRSYLRAVSFLPSPSRRWGSRRTFYGCSGGSVWMVTELSLG